MSRGSSQDPNYTPLLHLKIENIIGSLVSCKEMVPMYRGKYLRCCKDCNPSPRCARHVLELLGFMPAACLEIPRGARGVKS